MTEVDSILVSEAKDVSVEAHGGYPRVAIKCGRMKPNKAFRKLLNDASSESGGIVTIIFVEADTHHLELALRPDTANSEKTVDGFIRCANDKILKLSRFELDRLSYIDDPDHHMAVYSTTRNDNFETQ